MTFQMTFSASPEEQGERGGEKPGIDANMVFFSHGKKRPGSEWLGQLLSERKSASSFKVIPPLLTTVL